MVLFAVLYLLRSRAFPPALIWLGSVSYAVYLLHPIFGDVVRFPLPPAATVILSVVLTLLLSWLAHKFVERPLIDLGRRLAAH